MWPRTQKWFQPQLVAETKPICVCLNRNSLIYRQPLSYSLCFHSVKFLMRFTNQSGAEKQKQDRNLELQTKSSCVVPVPANQVGAIQPLADLFLPPFSSQSFKANLLLLPVFAKYYSLYMPDLILKCQNQQHKSIIVLSLVTGKLYSIVRTGTLSLATQYFLPSASASFRRL